MNQHDMETGELVEVNFPDVPNEHGIYMGPDYTSSWINGEPGNFARVMVFWDGGITSVPSNQIEVL
jgi:hypothetical protein